MSDNNDLAIIIPVRNTPNHLIARCLKSIYNAMEFSDNYNIQVILVDDCSDERNYEKYSYNVKKNFPKTISIRQETWVGIGGARNIGANSCNSKYLLFIDSDDVLKENAISTLMSYSSRKTLIFANHIKINNNNIKKYEGRVFLEILNSCNNLIDVPFFYTNFISMPSLIPKYLFSQVKGYPEHVYSGEHVALWGKLYLKSDLEEIIYIDKILYEYYPRENGNYHGNFNQHFLGKCNQLRILTKTLGYNVLKYKYYKSRYYLPSLYIPIFQYGVFQIPYWAEINNNFYEVKSKFMGTLYKRQDNMNENNQKIFRILIRKLSCVKF